MIWLRHARINKQMFWLLAISSLDGLAGSLFGIFLPVYFLTIGYSLSQVIVYFVALALFSFLFFVLAAAVASVFGLRLIMFLRLPFLLAYLVLLYFLQQQQSYSLIMIAIFVAAQSALFWFSMHVMFTVFSPETALGKSVGKFFMWPKLGALAAPLIGGLIIARFDFRALLVVALIIYISAFLPMLLIKDLSVKVDLSFKRLWQLVKRYKLFFWMTVLENIAGENGGLFLPLAIFLSGKNFISLGLAGSLLAVGGALFNYLIGSLADKLTTKKLFFTGALALSALWLLAYFLNTTWFFTFTAFTYGFLLPLVLVPYTALFYKLSKQNKVEDFIVFNEIPTLLGRLLIYGAAWLLVGHFTLVFVVAALVYLPFYFISRKIVV